MAETQPEKPACSKERLVKPMFGNLLAPSEHATDCALIGRQIYRLAASHSAAAEPRQRGPGDSNRISQNSAYVSAACQPVAAFLTFGRRQCIPTHRSGATTMRGLHQIGQIGDEAGDHCAERVRQISPETVDAHFRQPPAGWPTSPITASSVG